jgi:putative ABC transport system permease protein
VIRFLIKGLLRDRHRSLFPILVVTIGVMLTVFFFCWLTGVFSDIVDYNARFTTGHVKIMTRAYAEDADQMPNDLALLGVDTLIQALKKEFPVMVWFKRIRFAGLLDAPDSKGETKAQGPAMGLAVDLLSGDRSEIDRLNIEKALVQGRLPQKSGDMLISDELASRLGVRPGDPVTLLGSTMYGEMAMQNFIVTGTLRFGISAMDRGAMIADLADAQRGLDMNNSAGEILGYFNNGQYDDLKAEQITSRFNVRYAGMKDEFAPKMFRLKEQNGLAEMIDYAEHMAGLLVAVFVFAMSIVLWNAGLIGGLRRYGEVGVRLAIGENKGHVYRSMVTESVCIGIAGSIFGTAAGLGFSYLMQTKGIDIGSFTKNASMMMPMVFRAHITPQAYYLGFLPGLFSTVLGTLLAGVGIYQRKTAQLFKELEV